MLKIDVSSLASNFAHRALNHPANTRALGSRDAGYKEHSPPPQRAMLDERATTPVRLEPSRAAHLARERAAC